MYVSMHIQSIFNVLDNTSDDFFFICEVHTTVNGNEIDKIEYLIHASGETWK